MLVDLVQTTTQDGFRLDGILQRPSGGGAPAGPVDALCLVHGTTGNFYNSTLFEEAAGRLLALGFAVLRVNTRGHDGICGVSTLRGGRRLGAAYEVVDDCRHDIAAWVGWLRQQVGPRVGLLGHSMGAVKCLYALAHAPQTGAACLAALSPPRLSYSAFCTSAHGPTFLQTYGLAERHVAAGQPATLLEVNLPLPLVITAAGYVEKYGPDERYNFMKYVASVPCPTLFTFGAVELENNMAFRGVPEALQPLTARYPRLSVETIPGADHFYTGVRGELLSRVETWLRGLS